MITITNTITIVIATAITIAIITISPRPKGHTFAHNRVERGSRFRWKIWVGDLRSPGSNCLLFLGNVRLQLSTPWPWGIVRFRLSGHANVEIQNMISTNVMILATIRFQPLTTRHPPPDSCLPVPGACNSASSWTEHTGAYMGVYIQVRLRVSCLWRVHLGVCHWVQLWVYLRAYSEVYLRATQWFTWVRTWRCSW